MTNHINRLAVFATAVVLLLTASMASAQESYPEDGWWWDPDAAGRGYFIERQDDVMFIAAFIYTQSGAPEWLTAVGTYAPVDDADDIIGSFSGTVYHNSGGQCIGCDYIEPLSVESARGPLIIDFADNQNASLQWSGETIPISRTLWSWSDAVDQLAGTWLLTMIEDGNQVSQIVTIADAGDSGAAAITKVSDGSAVGSIEALDGDIVLMLVDASESTLPLILAETKRFYAGIKDANTLQVIALRLDDMPLSTATTNLRVPAEWEVQEAIWLQWPGSFEQTYEPAFAQMSEVISRYQKLHILVNNNAIETRARAAIVTAGGDPGHSNITWHSIANDSAWMRDNGPVYVTENGIMRVQNWEFDAWGGGFDTPGATVPYANDNLVPNVVGSLLGMNVEQIDIVQERGNLEFNGKDTLILNWSVIGDPNRNPNYTREQATADMKQYFGVSQVVWVEGWQANDLTRGHIDGIARFISQDTVVVGECLQGSICYTNTTEKAIYDNAATTIEDAGFTVIREPFDKSTNYNGGENFDIDYMNWLVGNGFVIAVGFEDTAQNAAAAARLKTYYPNRDIFVIDMLASWDSGGGAHCHTNDQPAGITSSGHTPWLP